MVETHRPRLRFKGAERWRGGVWSTSGISWRPFLAARGASGEGRQWDELEDREEEECHAAESNGTGKNDDDGKK
jgi:hypothetical protein